MAIATGTRAAPRGGSSGQGFALAVAGLALFVVTLDAVVVSVALPAVRSDLGGGVTGLQWNLAGYTLMFAALLPHSTSLVVVSVAMVLVGSGSPLTLPSMTAVLLNHVPAKATGVASGMFDTSHQLGGALVGDWRSAPCSPTVPAS